MLGAGRATGVKLAQERLAKREGGVIWHTQGSGKSILMVLLAKWILEREPDARVLVITDRDEFDKQIEGVMRNAGVAGADAPSPRVTRRDEFVSWLGAPSPRLICALIHKFDARGGCRSDADPRKMQGGTRETRNMSKLWHGADPARHHGSAAGRSSDSATAMIGRRSLLLATPALVVGAAMASTPFRLGLTSVFLDNEAPVIAGLTGALAETMGRAVLPVQRRSYAEVTRLLLDGGVDAAWLCGFPWLRNRSRLGLVALPLWRGQPLYRSYLIAGADDTATNLGDLRDGVHAFSDPDSNSGWLVTASDLARRRQPVETFFRRAIFTWGHRNVVRAVASGLTRSGSVDGYVWEALAAVEPALTVRTRIVTRSEWMGFPPMVARRHELSTPSIQAFTHALRRMGNTSAGRTALEQLQLDGFAQPDAGLFDPIAARLRDLAAKP